MEVSLSCVVLVGVLMCFMARIEAYTFYAGGRDGWVPNPSESYADWAGRNRFQVNDIIVFRYKKGENSVLVVSKSDYDACNINNPQQKLDGGDSTFKFPSSGPFYFISGNKDDCNKGQKLVVVVLSTRGAPTPTLPSPPTVGATPPATPPSTSPAQSASPPVGAVAPVTAPTTSPPSPAPTAGTPSSAPTPIGALTPISSSPAPSPASVSEGPTLVSPAGAPEGEGGSPPTTPSPTPEPADSGAYRLGLSFTIGVVVSVLVGVFVY